MSYTLKQLIEHFCDDPDSPFHNLQYQVRVNHRRLLARISREYGDCQLRNVRTRNLMAWHKAWKSGGKIAIAHALVARLRVLFRFGATLLEDGECIRLLNILSRTRFPNAVSRNLQITAEQVRAVRVIAHRRGYNSIAMAQALQFEVMLSQKDVIGEWVPISEPVTSDVVRLNKGKWLTGLRWEEIDKDLILRRNQNSEKEVEFDLKLAPMVDGGISAEVALLRNSTERRFRPVVPSYYARSTHSHRIIAKDAGVPDSVKNRHSLSGGTTHGLRIEYKHLRR
jgi:hypothetical protein